MECLTFLALLFFLFLFAYAMFGIWGIVFWILLFLNHFLMSGVISEAVYDKKVPKRLGWWTGGTFILLIISFINFTSDTFSHSFDYFWYYIEHLWYALINYKTPPNIYWAELIDAFAGWVDWDGKRDYHINIKFPIDMAEFEDIKYVILVFIALLVVVYGSIYLHDKKAIKKGKVLWCNHMLGN